MVSRLEVLEHLRQVILTVSAALFIFLLEPLDAISILLHQSTLRSHRGHISGVVDGRVGLLAELLLRESRVEFADLSAHRRKVADALVCRRSVVIGQCSLSLVARSDTLIILVELAATRPRVEGLERDRRESHNRRKWRQVNAYFVCRRAVLQVLAVQSGGG